MGGGSEDEAVMEENKETVSGLSWEDSQTMAEEDHKPYKERMCWDLGLLV